MQWASSQRAADNDCDRCCGLDDDVSMHDSEADNEEQEMKIEPDSSSSYEKGRDKDENELNCGSRHCLGLG